MAGKKQSSPSAESVGAVKPPAPQGPPLPSGVEQPGKTGCALPGDDTIKAQIVRLTEIRRSTANPRIFRENDPKVAELAASIEAVGLMQPILVRCAESDSAGTHLEIVAGERRWRAMCYLAKKNPEILHIPAFVRHLSDKQARELTVTENMQREDLSPIEEANGIGTLIDLGTYTLEEIADRLGKTVAWVARRAKLRDLIDAWKQAVSAPDHPLAAWSASHLEMVARFSPKIQKELLERYKHQPGISRRELRGELAEYFLQLSAAPWKISETGPGSVDACNICPKRTSVQPNLFEEEIAEVKGCDQCLDRECWYKKMHEFLLQKEKELRKQHPDLLIWDTSGNYTSGRTIPDDSPLRKKLAAERWNYSDAKPGEKGAAPALIIEGGGQGTVVWKKKHAETKRSGRPLDENGNALPKTLKERRQALEKRRTIRFIDMVAEILEREIEKPELVGKIPSLEIYAAVLTWGAESWNMVKKAGFRKRDEKWKEYHLLMKSVGDESRMVFQFRMLLGVLEHWKQELHESKLYDPDPSLPGCICDYFGLDGKAMQAEIWEQIPEPKAWAILNEDGTPKRKK